MTPARAVVAEASRPSGSVTYSTIQQVSCIHFGEFLAEGSVKILSVESPPESGTYAESRGNALLNTPFGSGVYLFGSSLNIGLICP